MAPSTRLYIRPNPDKMIIRISFYIPLFLTKNRKFVQEHGALRGAKNGLDSPFFL